ncbi:MAG: TIGR00730 family Rossman fold protein [Terrimonas sp.]|nr:TIGR00730 family Rossman fold protein [Terrimonas sp.]
MISTLAVFCGSKSGSDPLYTLQAEQLGQLLAEKNITLIYGGGSKGIMGALADAMMLKNGTVVGIIPKKLIEWEHQHEGISNLIVVDDMHTRKKKMYESCDAAMILPGGFGTLDELFEMLTWNQLAIHNKQIFILNAGGFYDHLIKHMQHLGKTGFLYDLLEERVHILEDPQQLLAYL